MMRLAGFVVLCCVVSISSGQEKCCIEPDMFTLTSGALVGWHVDQYFGTVGQTIFMVFDYTQPRFHFNVTSVAAANTTNVLVIDDYKQNVEWTIDPVAQKCQKAPLPEGKEMPKKCIPGNAQYIDQVNNPGDVLVNRWLYELKSPMENGQVSAAVTVDGCLPTGGSFVGTTNTSGQDVDVMEGIGYYNFEELNDVSKYFKLPSYCDSKFSEPMKTKSIKAAQKYIKRRGFL
ncbi:uncharacterized protein LOC117119298 [Anneissia japonica]|uniref:uncharacterized protein LOC117119298 n=1 Tax=Anneissia japonica TaxID=1529436 RepID=UPI001425A58B|nr:uncharacterized protein LOC117119298 [Anneissia japonica]